MVTAPVERHSYSVRKSSKVVAQGLDEFTNGGLIFSGGGSRAMIDSPHLALLRKPRVKVEAPYGHVSSSL